MRKLVVFNCSVNVVGGAVQNAVNFIKIIEKNMIYFEFDVFYLLSSAVYDQAHSLLKKDNYEVYTSPAKSFISRKKIRNKVIELDADLVYSTAGPAYVDFHCYHIMGCSNPYLLKARKDVKLLGNTFENIKDSLRISYQRKFVTLADEYIFQTEASEKDFFSHSAKKPSSVVYNAISQDFVNRKEKEHNLNIKLKRIIVPSAYYKHKNLELSIEALKLLLDRGFDFSLVFTVHDSDYRRELLPLIKKLNIEKNVTNIGPFKHEDALSLYLSSDIILQPSSLEVFSTTYIEAISLLKPLVVCDLNFSREICSEYPNYFDNGNAESLSYAILDSESHFSNIKQKAVQSEAIIKKYGSQQDRVKKILDILIRAL